MVSAVDQQKLVRTLRPGHVYTAWTHFQKVMLEPAELVLAQYHD